MLRRLNISYQKGLDRHTASPRLYAGLLKKTFFADRCQTCSYSWRAAIEAHYACMCSALN